jgi:hypothetical protein
VRNALAAAGFLLLFASIPSFGVAADGLSPATAGGAAVNPEDTKVGKSPGPAPASTAVPSATVTPGMPAGVPAAPAPEAPPAPAPSVPAQNLPATAAPVPAAVPSRLPAVPTVSFVAPPSEKAPDLVLSPGEVDLQVTKNIEDVTEEGEGMGEEFFATASMEIEKGRGGSSPGSPGRSTSSSSTSRPGDARGSNCTCPARENTSG